VRFSTGRLWHGSTEPDHQPVLRSNYWRRSNQYAINHCAAGMSCTRDERGEADTHASAVEKFSKQTPFVSRAGRADPSRQGQPR
jgi:hypothetical protein